MRGVERREAKAQMKGKLELTEGGKEEIKFKKAIGLQGSWELRLHKGGK